MKLLIRLLISSMKLPKLKIPHLSSKLLLPVTLGVIVIAGASSAWMYQANHQIQAEKNKLTTNLNQSNKKVHDLEQRDEFKINEAQKKEMDLIKKTYTDSISAYEKLTDLKAQKLDTSKLDVLY